MKIYKPKGNIILLALFILLASGIIGILVSLMMRDFSRYHSELQHYTIASSMEKAARELSYAIINTNKASLNFHYSSTENPAFFEQNFWCNLKGESNPDTDKRLPKSDCQNGVWLELKITGLSPLHDFALEAQLSKIIPLFYRSSPQSVSEALTNSPNQTFRKLEKLTLPQNNALNTEVYTDADQSYQVIANRSDQTQQIPIHTDTAYPQETTTITTQWNSQSSLVSREIQLKNAIPEYLRSDNYLQL